MIYPDKTEFKGNYTSGSREGKGTIFYTDGRTFEGDFKNDSPHGEGTLSYPDGTILSGSFVKGAKEGFLKLTTAREEIFSGHLKIISPRGYKNPLSGLKFIRRAYQKGKNKEMEVFNMQIIQNSRVNSKII